MLKTRVAAWLSQSLGIGTIAGLALTVAAVPARAADHAPPPPPYELTGMNGVGISVVWDEAAIRKALPPGIEPAKGMTGGINIYSVRHGNGIAPYSAAYLYVDVEGYDSPEGIKGRWMLAGIYGPEPKTSAALKEYNGLPVRPGTSRLEPTADGKRAIGIFDGKEIVTAEIKPVPNGCAPAAAELNYLARSPETGQVIVTKIPFAGDVCKANLVSAELTAPSGDAFAAYRIARPVGASEFRNGAFAFSAPVPAGK